MISYYDLFALFTVTLHEECGRPYIYSLCKKCLFRDDQFLSKNFVEVLLISKYEDYINKMKIRRDRDIDTDIVN